MDNVKQRVSSSKRTRLERVTWRHRLALYVLEVTPWQRRFIASNFRTLQECLAEPDAEVYAICTGRRAVGLAVLLLEDGEWWLWRLMIDRRQQDRGYGRDAVTLLTELVRARGGRTLRVSFFPGPGSPEPFYRRLGFTPAGEDGKEHVMVWEG